MKLPELEGGYERSESTGPTAHGPGTEAVPDPCGVSDGRIGVSDGSVSAPDPRGVSDVPGSAVLAASDGGSANDQRHGHTRDAQRGHTGTREA